MIDSEHPESAVVTPETVGAEHLVALDRDHPGFRDRAYRTRRDAIARTAMGYKKGDPVPDVEYTEDEHDVWRTVWRELQPMHTRYACRFYEGCADVIRLRRDRIPQLSEVNPALQRASGFHMNPVAGLVLPGVFLGHLHEGIFLSTQYARHHSTPLYTPEPDVVHELVGHAVTLASPAIAELNRLFGEALARGVCVSRLTRVYWYTMEFGVAMEEGEPRAYGAGLLSSFGELGHYAKNTPLLPFDIDRIAATDYDPTTYQSCLFLAPSLSEAFEGLTRWLNETPAG